MDHELACHGAMIAMMSLIVGELKVFCQAGPEWEIFFGQQPWSQPTMDLIAELTLILLMFLLCGNHFQTK
jgi:hypothetical protein